MENKCLTNVVCFKQQVFKTESLRGRFKRDFRWKIGNTELDRSLGPFSVECDFLAQLSGWPWTNPEAPKMCPSLTRLPSLREVARWDLASGYETSNWSFTLWVWQAKGLGLEGGWQCIRWPKVIMNSHPWAKCFMTIISFPSFWITCWRAKLRSEPSSKPMTTQYGILPHWIIFKLNSTNWAPSRLNFLLSQYHAFWDK